ncbi:UvrD-helicase domain-containing protein [Hyphomonas sp. CY54-11-8]|uniref:UvrD-helicase domain-containing protein n=1 Tax=Hyphomonas sp. CY54-11-8 TaxID=1280944 RepID=UPI0009DF6436|nr:UvrD-helicase domain-containing protein [Hyphomonas sp. CY54-11-8]
MTFRGFEGPAGTGKTYRLIEEAGEHLNRHPLGSHQRVLALTFMHGSRKRLDSRFRDTAQLRGRVQCMTIDSFAHSIFQRWRSMASTKQLQAEDFDQTCNACGQLLEQPLIAKWVAQSFPVIVVDEAQELKPERLRILKALTPHVTLFVAADEFQCLDERLDTAPFLEWFRAGNIEELTFVRRTGQRGLLEAGVALRSLQNPAPGTGLRIEYKFKNVMPFAVVASLSRSRGTRALIYAPSGRSWADEIIARAAQGMQSQGYGTIRPLRLVHEDSHREEKAKILEAVEGRELLEHTEFLDLLSSIDEEPCWMTSVISAIRRSAQTQGKSQWTASEATDLIERKAAHHRAYGFSRMNGIPVMSIHQAKNRQFDHVVLLWPPGVSGSDEQKARLLYNGITRAAHSCSVFVRTQPLLSQPPFLFGHAPT